MKNFTRWVLLASIAVAVSAVVFNFGPVASSQSSRKGERSKVNPTSPGRTGLENFDIRVRRAGEAEAAATRKGGGLTAEAQKQVVATQRQREAAAVVQQSMRAAEQSLAARLPNLKVNYNAALRVPEIVKVEGAGVLASAAANSKEEALRSFVSENAALYGLTRGQAAQLTKFSDYTNPAGNLSFVELEQQINGIPVFQGFVRGVLTPQGQLMSTVSLLAAGMRPSDLDTTPGIDAAEAVAAGIKSINLKVNAASLSVLDAAADGKSHVVSRGPLDEETKTSLMYFPVVPGHAVLAYSMTLWGPENSYYVFVDANTGQLLWRKNITQDQQTAYTYNIYDNDSPTPSAPVRSSLISPVNTTASEPQPPGISRTDVTRVSESPFDNLGWIPDGAGPNAPTTGNNVDAGIDRVAPNGIDPGGRATATNFVFRFNYRPDGSTDPVGSNNPLDPEFQKGAVTNLFFWSNRYHDSLYHLGFTEAARNFQTNNFGRGGLGNDAVRAEAQDSSGTNNANFNTPADGQPPRMQMFLWTGTPVRDGDLDQEVMYHELTHGTSNRLHANGSGLGSDTAQGMGEGWSDFYALSLLAMHTPDGDDGKRLYAMGAYDTRNYYRAIRRFPYAVKSAVAANGRSHNPLTLADIDPAQLDVSDAAFPVAPGQATQVHNQGEVWCSALIEVRAKLIEKLGFANGSQRVLQIVTDGMKLDPVNPTMLDARDSIIAADCAGFNGGDELDIWEGFRIRGMGFRAATSGIHVTENFESPNLKLLTITATEVPGSSNGDGVIDPGETARISVPLQNILCSVTVPSATATLSPGGDTATYPAFAPGAVNTETLDYTVPANTACGSSVPLTITVNSTLGPITYNYNLNIGRPSPLAPYENFDNVTPPALPLGWTTQRTGAGIPWQTTPTNPDTPPNSVFTTNPTNAGTSDLLSPTFPVNTALAQVSFRNSFNLEDNFDGMQLHIKIGNGPFREIIAAGGSFVSGGYNGEINDGAAWTGLSGGTSANPTYITSTVNLPPSANNQLVQLKWTVIGDANTIAPGQSGARIDTVQLSTTAQACNPFGVFTVSISGHLRDSVGNPVAGIQVTLSGTTNATATTNADGFYSFPNLVSGGDYTVAPTTPGFDYLPQSRTYNDLTTNVTDADFTVAFAASISGRVTSENGAVGIDGITITLTGTESRTTVTSGGGFYSFQNLTRGGNYTVTPSGGNNTFTPPSRTYNDL
ncbi:MAG TPA: M36 family metallopeptidase, partial [Pyrinomonadaceae bacterium]